MWAICNTTRLIKQATQKVSCNWFSTQIKCMPCKCWEGLQVRPEHSLPSTLPTKLFWFENYAFRWLRRERPGPSKACLLQAHSSCGMWKGFRILWRYMRYSNLPTKNIHTCENSIWGGANLLLGNLALGFLGNVEAPQNTPLHFPLNPYAANTGAQAKHGHYLLLQ